MKNCPLIQKIIKDTSYFNFLIYTFYPPIPIKYDSRTDNKKLQCDFNNIAKDFERALHGYNRTSKSSKR